MLLTWHSTDVVRVALGDSDGRIQVSGLAAYEALIDFCEGDISALVAGEMCMVRVDSETVCLRVAFKRLSISSRVDELKRALARLAKNRPESAKLEYPSLRTPFALA
jgi:hypothetical protein